MTLKLLVTGAAGQLGRRVISHLLDLGANSIIATTRDPSKLADLAAKGVDVRFADFDKPETLGAAFAGADRMLLISTDAVYVPGQRLSQQKAAVAAAGKAGVRHIIYTSFTAPKPDPDNIIADDHFWTEQAIAASSMSWTFMRHSIYAESLLLFLPLALQSGHWVTATGNKPSHYVTREDCARADAAVLFSDDTTRRIHDITGPAAVTGTEVAAIVTEITGKPLVHIDAPLGEFRNGLEKAGMPPAIVGAITGFAVATACGFFGTVTPAVEELTGRKPTSVREFLLSNKAALTG